MTEHLAVSPTSWQYLGVGIDSGEANMVLDRKLLDEMRAGDQDRPIVRLYLWDKPTISLGTNQVGPEVVDLQQISRLGYNVVTRPTGGRALLHKGDLCYAIVAHKSHHPAFRSLTSTYRAIGAALAGTLQLLGISQTDVPSEATETRHSLNPCFAMLSPFEVAVRGKKICGSAQFRSGGYFLQHGSLRIRDIWNLDDLTKVWPSGYQVDADQITSVDKELGRVMDIREIEEKFLISLERQFEIKVIPPPTKKSCR